MRASQFRKTATSPRLFVGPKSSAAIPISSLLLRDAVLQATLDPAVRTIDFVPSARVDQATVKLNAVVLQRDDGRYMLDVVEARPLRDIDGEGLFLLALEQLKISTLELTAADIRKEPRFSNCREIWRHKAHPVSMGMRMGIQRALEDEGPLSILQLEAIVQSRFDIETAVFALACDAVLELDLDKTPLGHNTIVSRSPALRPCSGPTLPHRLHPIHDRSTVI
jgi:hypothetical protein